MSKRGVNARIDKDLMEFRKKIALDNEIDMMDVDRELAKLGQQLSGKSFSLKEIKF